MRQREVQIGASINKVSMHMTLLRFAQSLLTLPHFAQSLLMFPRFAQSLTIQWFVRLKKMSWYPLIKRGQMSHKYAFLRVSRTTLLRLGASIKRVNGAIILENGLVPPCSILLTQLAWTRRY